MLSNEASEECADGNAWMTGLLHGVKKTTLVTWVAHGHLQTGAAQDSSSSYMGWLRECGCRVHGKKENNTHARGHAAKRKEHSLAVAFGPDSN